MPPITTSRTIRHCRACGSHVVYRLPDDGDTRPRAICTACHTVHYENPLIVVGTVPYTADGRILLCQRAIEPRYGKWTLPAGFMELGESAEQGAVRETQEESGAVITLQALFTVMSVPRVGQVHLFYRALLQHETLAPDPRETLAAQLFTPEEIPWEELAFTTVRETLTRFLADFARQQFGTYSVEIA